MSFDLAVGSLRNVVLKEDFGCRRFSWTLDNSLCRSGRVFDHSLDYGSGFSLPLSYQYCSYQVYPMIIDLYDLHSCLVLNRMTLCTVYYQFGSVC